MHYSSSSNPLLFPFQALISSLVFPRHHSQWRHQEARKHPHEGVALSETTTTTTWNHHLASYLLSNMPKQLAVDAIWGICSSTICAKKHELLNCINDMTICWIYVPLSMSAYGGGCVMVWQRRRWCDEVNGSVRMVVFGGSWLLVAGLSEGTWGFAKEGVVGSMWLGYGVAVPWWCENVPVSRAASMDGAAVVFVWRAAGRRAIAVAALWSRFAVGLRSMEKDLKCTPNL